MTRIRTFPSTEEDLGECHACFDSEDYEVDYQAFVGKARARCIEK